MNGLIVTDDEEVTGFLGQEIKLSKGLLYKRVNFLNLVILVLMTACLIYNFEWYDLKSESLGLTTVILVISNILVPFSMIYLIDPENLKDYLGEPSEIERELSGLRPQDDFYYVVTRPDFYLNCFMAFTVIGGARMLEENGE